MGLYTDSYQVRLFAKRGFLSRRRQRVANVLVVQSALAPFRNVSGFFTNRLLNLTIPYRVFGERDFSERARARLFG